jgi:hypothetical protein
LVVIMNPIGVGNIIEHKEKLMMFSSMPEH